MNTVEKMEISHARSGIATIILTINGVRWEREFDTRHPTWKTPTLEGYQDYFRRHAPYTDPAALSWSKV